MRCRRCPRGQSARDTLTPSIPGTRLEIRPEDLAGHRPSYRLLAYHLSRRGYPVSPDLHGDDRPDEVEDLYRETFRWARAGGR